MSDQGSGRTAISSGRTSDDLQVVIWDIVPHFHPFLDQLIEFIGGGRSNTGRANSGLNEVSALDFFSLFTIILLILLILHVPRSPQQWAT